VPSGGPGKIDLMRSFAGKRSLRLSTTVVLFAVLTAVSTTAQEPDAPAPESLVTPEAEPSDDSPSTRASGGAGSWQDVDAAQPEASE